MKIKNLIITGVALVATSVSLSCFAQARGDDLFGVPRSIILSNPQLLPTTLANVTNGPIDTHGFSGIGIVELNGLTNTSATAITAQLFTSVDQTNLVALSNYAYTTNISFIYTNLMYGGTNLVATNPTLLPGVPTTPVAGTAGWATPYLAQFPYTNTGAVDITKKGYTVVGYNVADAARYLYVIYTETGSNAVVGAVFKGYRQQ